MVSPPPTRYQASQPLLKPEERPPYCRIPALSEVPPDHKAVLQVRQYQAIIEREEGLRTQHPSRPTQNPHHLPHLSPDPLNVARPSKPPIYPDPKKPRPIYPPYRLTPYLQPPWGRFASPRSAKIDILSLLEIQSKSIAPKPPAELTQAPVYPPKKLSGVIPC